MFQVRVVMQQEPEKAMAYGKCGLGARNHMTAYSLQVMQAAATRQQVQGWLREVYWKRQ